MKMLTNNMTRHMTTEEHQAIIDCEKIIEKAFKHKVHQCFINADRADPERSVGLNFTFDLYEVRR